MMSRIGLLVAACLRPSMWAAALLALSVSVNANEPELPGVIVGINHNDGSANQPEFAEQIFRSAEPGRWPVPPISSRDLGARLVPIVVSGQRHALSGGPEKLTDGAGATGEDDPKNCFFF